jgi:hypothetical protein
LFAGRFVSGAATEGDQRIAHVNQLAGLDVNFFDDPGLGRRDFHRRLVGLDFHERLIFGHGVTFGDRDLDDLGLVNAFA